MPDSVLMIPQHMQNPNLNSCNWNYNMIDDFKRCTADQKIFIILNAQLPVLKDFPKPQIKRNLSKFFVILFHVILLN